MIDSDRVVGKAKELGGAVQGTVGDAVHSPGNSVEGRFREAEGSVQNLYGQAKDMLRQGLDKVEDATGHLGSDYGSYARQGAEAARHRVGDQPLVALLVAGVVGYLLAYLTHSRR